jgi:hypothetical protein
MLPESDHGMVRRCSSTAVREAGRGAKLTEHASGTIDAHCPSLSTEQPCAHRKPPVPNRLARANQIEIIRYRPNAREIRIH